MHLPDATSLGAASAPRRVVSLCPSLTELVFALGRGDRLVGITDYCVKPTGRVCSVPKVGGTKDPDVAAILALRPDLVLLNEEENRVEDAHALQRAGVRCLPTFPRSVDEAAWVVRRVGDALGARGCAEAIAVDVERRAERAAARADGHAPVRHAYLIWRKPWMAVGAGTYVDSLLAVAGGENVFADRGRYPAIHAEALANAEPERVLLSSEPFPFREKHVEELAGLTGLPRERFRVVDGELLSWHGPRTPEGLDYAADLFATARAERGRNGSL